METSAILNRDPGQWPIWGYDLIYADPPWTYNDKSLSRGGALRHYQTMTVEEIAALPVVNLGAPDSVLYLWVTPPQLQEGLRVMKAWGFTYKTFGFVWPKTAAARSVDLDAPGQGLAIGMGHGTRANSEPCLYGVRGKGLKRVDASVRQTQLEAKGAHSAKPARFRQSLEQLYGPQRRVELFAREQVPGWDCWGLGVEEGSAV